jgi:hypothetical protein
MNADSRQAIEHDVDYLINVGQAGGLDFKRIIRSEFPPP